MNQTKEIYDYLKSGKSLTALEALEMFGCFRLGARIFDLKERGVSINSEMIKTDSGKRISRYSLKS